MNIGGIVPFTTIDYPDTLATVLFCQGCPWRCGYCHNPQLQSCHIPAAYDWPGVLAFLRMRIGFIEAVVFSGGEPTQQNNLLEAICEVRSMGFKIGLHTSGVYPEKLAAVLPWLDWIGLDIKAPFEDYEKITGIPNSGQSTQTSLRMIIQSAVSYECRTTVHACLLTTSDLERLADQLSVLGVTCYALQAFRPKGCENKPLCELVLPPWSEALVEKLKHQFPQFELR